LATSRALIVGIAGQDGSYLAELLVERGYEVVGTVRRSPDAEFENLAAVRDRIELRHADLRDPAGLVRAIEEVQPHELYNVASTSTVQGTWDDPLGNVGESAVAVTEMLEAIRRGGLETRYYQASSSQLYGRVDASPQDELTPMRPLDPYGAAKLYAQRLVASYRDRYGLHGSSGIAFNHESPRRPSRYVSRKVTRAAAAIKLGLEGRLLLGDLDAVRDWGHARDFAEGMWLMLQADDGDDYVLATGVGRTVRELVETAFGCVGLDPADHVDVDESLLRPPESAPLIGDPSKARERLGWQNRTAFAEMIGTMVERDLEELARAAGP
jgi:GDPmannose 4,6-dehydratase